jgi:mono/diheme cytochrome c family protein
MAASRGTIMLGTLTLALSFAAPASGADGGFYAASQAQAGLILYNDQCAECHRPDLTGAMGPALKGAAFTARWGGRAISDLFAYEHRTMPAVNPGAVPPEELWPITAYILERNGLPAGNAALDESTAGRILPK